MRALVTVDVTPAQPQCTMGRLRGGLPVKVVPGARSSPEGSPRLPEGYGSRRPMFNFDWQIKSPGPSMPWCCWTSTRYAVAGSVPRQTPEARHLKGQRDRALRVVKTEHCRGWQEQAGSVGIAGRIGESVQAEEVPRSMVAGGGVLNAAMLAQDWPRGQGVSDGLAGPGL